MHFKVCYFRLVSYSGEPHNVFAWAQRPLARLFQFCRLSSRREAGKAPTQRCDSIDSRCLRLPAYQKEEGNSAKGPPSQAGVRKGVYFRFCREPFQQSTPNSPNCSCKGMRECIVYTVSASTSSINALVKGLQCPAENACSLTSGTKGLHFKHTTVPGAWAFGRQ